MTMLNVDNRRAPNITIKILAVFLVILMFISCGFYMSSGSRLPDDASESLNIAVPDTKQLAAKFRTALITSEDGNTNVSVSFPKCDKAGLNSLMKQYVDRFVQEFRNTVEPDSRASLSAAYDVFVHDSNTYSVLYTVIEKRGDSTNESHCTAVYDYAKERQYALDDMFNGDEDYLEELSEAVIRHVEDDRLLGQSFDEEKVKASVKAEKDTFSKLVVKEDELTVLFDSGELVDTYDQLVEVNIPIDEISGILNFGEPSISEIEVPEPVTEPETEQETEPPTEPPTEPATQPPQPAEQKVIALTFDDGPSDNTAALLHALKERNVKATFFMVGNRIKLYPNTVKLMVSDGHEIGNHTFEHKNLTKLSEDDIRYQLNATDEALMAVAGVQTTVIRPPEGAYNDTVKAVAGKPLIMWSVDPMDWKYRDTDTVVNNILSTVKSGDIVLLHDLYKTSTDAALKVIDDLKQQGYEFVTVSELYARYGKQLEAGKLHFKAS